MNSFNHSSKQHRLIEVHGLTKAYQTDAGLFQALNNVALQVEPGEFVAVVGKSGSGKTTLINMLTGLDRPSAGEIWINQAPVHQLNEGQLAAWRGASVGVVFQFFQLLPTLTALENVMLPMDFCHKYRPNERVERARQLLAEVEIDQHAHKLPANLSGGQQQRVAIARALANDPPIIAADEPTGNLDSRTANAVYALFEKLTGQGKAVLMVTHDPDLARRAGRQIVIQDGQILEDTIRPETAIPRHMMTGVQ